ncbi:hypothetical protein PG993_000091 [Apiospora rasikravindrae]|uniref:Uncharacterized protein n=1 Tax=Apiospora rasikravindrae TaxID=990691 RepID=A0ABR1U7K7_9PEZI
MKLSALVLTFATAFVAADDFVDGQTNTTVEGLKARAKGGEVLIGTCQLSRSFKEPAKSYGMCMHPSEKDRPCYQYSPCQIRGASCSYFKNGKKSAENYEALCASDLSLVDGSPINF